jgi:hypothetical protein
LLRGNGGVIAGEAKQSRAKALMLLLDRHGGQSGLAMTLRSYSSGFCITRFAWAENRHEGMVQAEPEPAKLREPAGA